MLYWLFLGYYDQYFVKYLLGAIVLSILVDLSYLVLWMLGLVGNNIDSY